MKIIVLHGDDTTKSYERLTKFMDEAKRRGWEVLDFDLDSIFNQSLFEKERFYVLRDIKRLDKKALQKLESITSGNLILYNQGIINATILKTLNASTVEKFELPKLLWNFLDTFSLTTFQKVLETENAEMVMWWMVQRLKELYWVKVGNPNFPSWRVNKLKSQSARYTKVQLENAISNLSDIDAKSKMGLVNLKESLDLFIIKRLAL